MPIGHSLSGRGGSVVVRIACSGCGAQVDFASSSMSTTESRRNVVSYAIRIAAFVLVLDSLATISSLVAILECMS